MDNKEFRQQFHTSRGSIPEFGARVSFWLKIILAILIVSSCALGLYLLLDSLSETNDRGKANLSVSNYLGVAQTKSKLGHYRHYAVSSDAAPCAAVGTSLLEKGGSAVDAAIGTLLCMGVAIPNSLGIGGGCFMTIYDENTGNAMSVNGRETAPHYATENMFKDNELAASRGPLSVGVPGELAAYKRAHDVYGKLNWSDLFEMPIRMAQKGLPVQEHLSAALRNNDHSKYLTPPMWRLFTNNQTGKPVQEGDTLVLHELGETFKRLRDHGIDDFYYGETGRRFIADLQRDGGKMTMHDLNNYRVSSTPGALKVPISYDTTLYTQPVPGSGLVLGVIMKIMRRLGYHLGMDEASKPQHSSDAANLYYHRLVESFKFAYAKRAGLEDEPEDPERMDDLIRQMLSDEFIEYAAENIDELAHDDDRYDSGNSYFKEDHGTAHCSVIDAQGLAVAVTSSVNLYFGNGGYSESTGIIYNDVMDDFTSPNLTNRFGLEPSQFNRIVPGRQPISSMAPSIFVDPRSGRVKLIIGASGGSMITSSISLVSIRHLYLGDDLKTSVDGPRIHHQYKPDEVKFESSFMRDVLDNLQRRGHKVSPIRGRSSVVMAIAKSNDGLVTANSDYRKGGSVDGL